MSSEKTATATWLVPMALTLVLTAGCRQAEGAGGTTASGVGGGEGRPAAEVLAADVEPPAPERRVEPKPLSKVVEQGLAYLVNQQHPSGGWGQGGGWRQADGGGRVAAEQVANERADVGNTAIATLALVRAGHTPAAGEYRESVARGIDFICRSVEGSAADSLFVTDVRDTQIQLKVGRYVDTFLSVTLLPEVKGRMGDAAANARLAACLDRVIAKIEAHQRDDGTFAGNEGWASVLSQGQSVRGLNKASQQGAAVSEVVLERARKQAASSYDPANRSFTESAGGAASSDAGVGLYTASSGLAGMADSVATGQRMAAEAHARLADRSATGAEKEEARMMLDRFEADIEVYRDAKGALLRQLDDEQFVAGFGSNGGEELLSYMNISEALVAEGGEEWEAWDRRMTANLDRVQNADGSWSGHHCITGRTFVTSTALLVLMADRAPLPASPELAGGR